MDYKNPNYSEIFAQRAQMLAKLRADKTLLAAAKVHYKTAPWEDRKSTRLNSSHIQKSRMPSSA